jgi:hypothetical protein
MRKWDQNSHRIASHRTTVTKIFRIFSHRTTIPGVCNGQRALDDDSLGYFRPASSKSFNAE